MPELHYKAFATLCWPWFLTFWPQLQVIMANFRLSRSTCLFCRFILRCLLKLRFFKTSAVTFLKWRLMPRLHQTCRPMSPGNMCPGRATCIRIHRRTRRRIQVARLVRNTCGLCLGDIIRPTIHLCHGRLVSLCIQQQTGDKLATTLSPTQDTCRRRQVDTTCIRQHVYSRVYTSTLV